MYKVRQASNSKHTESFERNYISAINANAFFLSNVFSNGISYTAVLIIICP